jgi:hypothetical protein
MNQTVTVNANETSKQFYNRYFTNTSTEYYVIYIDNDIFPNINRDDIVKGTKIMNNDIYLEYKRPQDIWNPQNQFTITLDNIKNQDIILSSSPRQLFLGGRRRRTKRRRTKRRQTRRRRSYR